MQPTATTIRNHASFLMDVCNETAKAEQLLTRADFVEEANIRTRVRWPGPARVATSLNRGFAFRRAQRATATKRTRWCSARTIP